MLGQGADGEGGSVQAHPGDGVLDAGEQEGGVLAAGGDGRTGPGGLGAHQPGRAAMAGSPAGPGGAGAASSAGRVRASARKATLQTRVK